LPQYSLLLTLRNMATLDNNAVIQGALKELQGRLPPGWRVSLAKPPSGGGDAVAKVTAPDRRSGSIWLELRTRLEPKGILPLLEVVKTRVRGPLIVVARYLSEATRAGLRSRDLGYLDLTGNVRIVVPEPGLFIETEGAREDPDRKERPARSLKGAKAGRIVRALVDRRQPPGVRELAAATKIDAGYVSRVLALLDSQALITRVGRGRIATVDWISLLRRWAEEAPLESRGQTRTYLEPRGLTALVARLGKSGETYAITGALAAAAFAPVAPARLAILWVRDAAGAATRLGLRPTEAGANVLLLEPGDEGVFEGAAPRDGVCYAAPSQVAADLLTSPGRGPAEGEELIDWMRANEDAWRR